MIVVLHLIHDQLWWQFTYHWLFNQIYVPITCYIYVVITRKGKQLIPICGES